MDWNLDNLEYYNEKIEKIAQNMGLKYYPQEFEICDYEEMIGYMTYVGMPSHYPHWSYGKSFEKTILTRKLGMSGLPYEMVINSNPCLAYLMTDNTLLLQILTIAHVYGHNDFFANNRMFTQATDAKNTLEMFKIHSDRIRRYMSDPSIGADAVERILNAAHAIKYQMPKNIGYKVLSYEDEKARHLANNLKSNDANEFSFLQTKTEKAIQNGQIIVNNFLAKKDVEEIPLNPEEDLLRFIAHYGKLKDWERDIINIVREEMQYFAPQIETKVMNEGWASYHHYKILNELELDPELHTEFLVRHNQVIRPHYGQINPYFVGFKIFEWIDKNIGKEEMFTARSIHRDESFIRHYLNQELCDELNLFEYDKRIEKDGKTRLYEVTEVANDDGWMKIRDRLAGQVGLNGIPYITIDNYDRYQDTLYISQRDKLSIEKKYAQETLKHIFDLWGGPVAMECIIDKKREVIGVDKKRNVI